MSNLVALTQLEQNPFFKADLVPVKKFLAKAKVLAVANEAELLQAQANLKVIDGAQKEYNGYMNPVKEMNAHRLGLEKVFKDALETQKASIEKYVRIKMQIEAEIEAEVRNHAQIIIKHIKEAGKFDFVSMRNYAKAVKLKHAASREKLQEKVESIIANLEKVGEKQYFSQFEITEKIVTAESVVATKIDGIKPTVTVEINFSELMSNPKEALEFLRILVKDPVSRKALEDRAQVLLKEEKPEIYGVSYKDGIKSVLK